MEPSNQKPLAGRNIFAIAIIGTLFIIFLGSALHFTYELSGSNLVVGAISAVNESVWEHLKLVFWPSLFWMLIAIFPLKNTVNGFFSAKAIGTYIIVIFVPVVFYSYCLHGRKPLCRRYSQLCSRRDSRPNHKL